LAGWKIGRGKNCVFRAQKPRAKKQIARNVFLTETERETTPTKCTSISI